MARRNMDAFKAVLAENGLPPLPKMENIGKTIGVDLSDVGLDQQFEAAVYVGLTVMFAFFCLAVKGEKKRAWFLTAISSGLCTIAGAYVCWTLDWDFRVTDKMLGETAFTRFSVCWFRALNVLDIVLGFLFYRSQLHPLTTWVHHLCYIALCFWMLGNHCSVYFGVFLLEEFPTFIMSIGRLKENLRSDILFGLTYFILRVCFHTWVGYLIFAGPGGGDKMPVIRFNVGITWTLHMHWFMQWIRQQVRLFRERKASKLQD